MLSDIEIAQRATLRPIVELARDRLQIPEGELVCGDILTMPGLPAQPSSSAIDVDEGRIVGLFGSRMAHASSDDAVRIYRPLAGR